MVVNKKGGNKTKKQKKVTGNEDNKQIILKDIEQIKMYTDTETQFKTYYMIIPIKSFMDLNKNKNKNKDNNNDNDNDY